MSACSEFTQNAWRRDLCANCQRARSDHSPQPKGGKTRLAKSSPVPAKRTSVILKATSSQQPNGVGLQNQDKIDPTNDDIENANSSRNVNKKNDSKNSKTSKEKELVESSNGNTTFSESVNTPKTFNEKNSPKSVLSDKKEKKENKNGKVAFKECDPEIIGYDGGCDNLMDDDVDSAEEAHSSGDEFSFTEEEKEFAMLALENTIWNSDVRNLKIGASVQRKPSRVPSKEFEDLELASLWKPNRFHNLRDCDAVIKTYGTFPMRKKPALSKIAVDDVFSSDIELHRIADNVCEKADSESSGSENYKHPLSGVDRLKSGSSSASLPSSSTSLSSESDGKPSSNQTDVTDAKIPLNVAVPYKIVDIIKKDNPISYTVGDITDCLYDVSQSGSPSSEPMYCINEETGSASTKDIISNRKDGNSCVRSASGAGQNKENENKWDGNASFSDSESTVAGLEVVELLNDVLASYGEIETKYMDYKSDWSIYKDSPKDETNKEGQGTLNRKETGKLAKKSAEFEARMASVAANLDLTKSRNKRPAPRPPSSPPPEPQLSPKPQLSPTKKLSNQIEPNFKMVTVGKSIVTPPQLDPPISPKSQNDPTLGLEDPSLESMESFRIISCKSTDVGKAKRGITSFFRNILRRGRDSIDMPLEQSNPDITFLKAEIPKTDVPAVIQPENKDENTLSPSERRNSKLSPQPKFRVLPPSTPPPANPPSSSEPPSSPAGDTKSSTDDSVDNAATVTNSVSSPPVLPKNKGLSSPKQVLKRDQAKSSPPLQRASVCQTKEETPNAAKPQIPTKPPTTVQDESGIVVRRRTKSPKKGVPPVPPPTRTSVPNRVSESRNPDFARELERRLSRSTEGAASIRDTKRSVGQLPPSPTSPVPEFDESAPTSPTGLGKPEELTKVEEEPLREKIELPTAAPQSRKSFLGKLGNKKPRAPPPPSVKRAKSITESSLPRGDRRAKKINVADISGPVLVTDMTNTKILENRRNTISLGDDPAFASGLPLCGSTSSGSGAEKSLEDLPVISPLGSFENLYETILPKVSGRYFYDPVTGAMMTTKTTICPNVPAEGYLEPVPTVPTTASNTAATTTTTTTTTNNPLPSTIEEESPSETFIEPEFDENRRFLLASQPIYEEINGYNKMIEHDTTSQQGDTVSMISTLSQVSQNTETDFLTLPQDCAPRSQSKETLSSESDTQSTCSTLSRPKPAPRKKPKKSDKSTSEQYVSMNRPSATVVLGEDRLRDVYSKLTGMNLQTLQEVYSQVEKILSQDRLIIPLQHLLKWQDFDIYGQPLHASERCIVYNAKFRINNTACQLMLLHSRPATEMTATTHPSLLKPVAVFADTIPFSFLTEEFIKTSQLVQNSIYDTSLAKCFCAVGSFDIIENLDSHLTLLRETLTNNFDAYMHIVLSIALQLLSAMSHCLDEGYTVTETDFRDIFLVSRNDLRGKVITFLPNQRSHDVPQGEAMCSFLDRLLDDATEHCRDSGEKFATVGVVQKLRFLLEPRKIECLSQVRSVVEYLLWGPYKLNDSDKGEEVEDNLEEDLCLWLEKERATAVGRFAKNVSGFLNGVTLEEYYQLKFLLKSSAAGLAESARRLP